MQVTIDVNVTCKIFHPEVACTDRTLKCVGFLSNTSEAHYVLSASCRQIADFSGEQSREQWSTPSANEIPKNASIVCFTYLPTDIIQVDFEFRFQ